ncbi:MAG: helix-turn-helix transcriptional regulator [Comamonadaceae bacterium]|nr:helix-turn-helix transcriptional regulator [Comamonadaceae bacterium]
MKKYSRTLSSLRHLCSLDLPGEMLVPQFLNALGEIVPTEVSTLVWHGPDLTPVRMFSEQPESRLGMQAFLQFLDEHRRVGFDWFALTAAAINDRDDPRVKRIFGFVENEVRAPLHLPHEFTSHFTAIDSGYFSINLWRGGRPYSAAERAFAGGVIGYLQYALNRPADLRPLPFADDDRLGVMLLDACGRIAQVNEQALALAAMAANAPARTGFGCPQAMAAICRQLALDLRAMNRGAPAAPPQRAIINAWGRITMRATWLQPPNGNGDGTIAILFSRQVPRRLKLWQSIHGLRLSPRQQEVALLSAEGHTQQDIARRLNIGLATTIDHIRALYDRLDIPVDREALRQRLLG